MMLKRNDMVKMEEMLVQEQHIQTEQLQVQFVTLFLAAKETLMLFKTHIIILPYSILVVI